MGHSSTKKKRLLEQKAELKSKRRSGLIRVIAPIAGFVVAAAIKTAGEASGATWATSSFVNAAFFVGAIVLAGVAGYGSRDYRRATLEIREIEDKLAKLK
ncbi:hypothetical protein GMI70_00115 [Eggerthellaceae bacterium zg-893]|nr:hypothetical protein [Eggerthellaceae bacterium zg-893]